jgi:hypothetical protein
VTAPNAFSTGFAQTKNHCRIEGACRNPHNLRGYRCPIFAAIADRATAVMGSAVSESYGTNPRFSKRSPDLRAQHLLDVGIECKISHPRVVCQDFWRSRFP